MSLLKLVFILLIAMPHIFANECKLLDITVLGGNKVKDFKDGKLIKFYPTLTDFKTYFPSQVNIHVKTVGDCSNSQAKLSIFHSKGQRKFHYHEGKNGDKEIVGAHTVNAKYLTTPSYTSDNQKEKNNQINFNNIPHRKFYDVLSEKNWINKAKYSVILMNSKKKKTQVKEIELESPLIH